MPKHVLIDGNNLLHAMHEHAPIPHVGRETLVKIIERWASRTDDRVTIVFDGPTPPAGLAEQMALGRVTVCYSAPHTADDIIVAEIHSAPHPTHLHIVTSDKAIRSEARHRRSQDTDSSSFVRDLFDKPGNAQESSDVNSPTDEKPETASRKESDEWMITFGYDPNANRSSDGLDPTSQ
jgi:predicted RNA-binding protein with PIN domain